MIEDVCAGCGRAIAGDPVSCAGCGRPLERGTGVPPGWGVTVSATATLPRTPRWRLAGIDTARPETAENTVPRTPAELFRPPSTGEDTVEMEPAVPGGPGWHVRPRQPRPLRWTPAAAAVVAATSVTRTASRIAYWALVGGILATSSAAVLLLTVHMVRGR
jgi:hypothetical protein